MKSIFRTAMDTEARRRAEYLAAIGRALPEDQHQDDEEPFSRRSLYWILCLLLCLALGGFALGVVAR